MKATIFNFLVLQAVIWSIVFSSKFVTQTDEVNYASISDTWEVVKIGESSNPGVVLHYPTFYKLTLNIDGTYIRLKNDETLEEGEWNLNKTKSILSLKNEEGTKNYEIIQLPNSDTESFIIKEHVVDINSIHKIEYELAREQ
jgi:hypothetical protein